MSARPQRETANPSLSVVRTVSEESGTDTMELPPLYETIDPDALDAAIDDLETGEIAFKYAGYSVTVDATGDIAVAATATADSRRAEPATDD